MAIYKEIQFVKDLKINLIKKTILNGCFGFNISEIQRFFLNILIIIQIIGFK